MKIKFETFFRIYVFALLSLLLWTVWRASAQDAETPAAPPPAVALQTNASGSVSYLIRIELPQTAAGGNATNAATSASPTTNGKTNKTEEKPLPTPEWIKKLAVYMPFLLHKWGDNEIWKYLFSLIYIFLAFYISKLADYLTRVWLKHWAEKTKTKFDDVLLSVLNGPVRVILFVGFLRVGLEVFRWPEIVENVLTKGFTIIIAGTITYLVLKFIDLLMNYWRHRTKNDADQHFNEQLFPIIRKSLKVFVIVVAVLVTLSNIGVDVTAAIASLSIGGLAVGLAAQDTLANLFGAIAVFVDKPFRIGDLINVEGNLAIVESIGLRSSRVRNLDGHLITIPNKIMGSAIITNITKRPSIKTVMNIGVTYDTPSDRVQRAVDIMNEVFRAHPQTADVWITFNTFADCSLNLQVIHWWGATDYKAYLDGLHKMNLAIKKRFDEEGLNFAFPTRTLYVKQDSNWQLSSGPETEAAS